MYLDLSFTTFEDLTLLEGMANLKSLIIAGSAVSDFSSLCRLGPIEVLSVRHCTGLASLNDVSLLFALRSLDMGYCSKITTISPLSQLTRLEELVLDSSAVHGLSDAMAALSGLPELRLLNIENTPLSDEDRVRDRLLDVLRSDVCFEEYSRDTLFLLAVIENDSNSVWNFIGSGQNINVRATTDLSTVLTTKWKDVFEESTVFVDCDYEEEELRPTAIHLAIIFQNLDVLEVLLYCGADVNLLCWMSFVSIVDGALFYSEEKEKMHEVRKYAENPNFRLKVTFDAFELAQEALEQNLCRFARGFKRDKIVNWKEIGRWNFAKITSILTGTIDVDIEFHNTGPEPSRTKAVAAPRDRTSSLESVGSRISRDRTSSLVDDEGDDDADENSLISMTESLQSISNPKGVQDWSLLRGQLAWRNLPMARKHAGMPLRVKPTKEQPQSEVPKINVLNNLTVSSKLSGCVLKFNSAFPDFVT